MVSFISSRVWHTIMIMTLASSLILVLPVSQASAADMTHQVTKPPFQDQREVKRLFAVPHSQTYTSERLSLTAMRLFTKSIFYHNRRALS